MFLSDKDIRAAVQSGDIVIRDFDEERLQPASYDILLGNKFWVVSGHESLAIDPVKKVFPKMIEKELNDGEEYYLHPGVTVLGTSKDYFGSEKYLVQLSGKSSLARIGLVVHNTAGIINPGHFLNITFELCNFNKLPIILRPGMRIGQILFSKLSSQPEYRYHQIGRYQGKDWDHFAGEKKKQAEDFHHQATTHLSGISKRVMQKRGAADNGKSNNAKIKVKISQKNKKK